MPYKALSFRISDSFSAAILHVNTHMILPSSWNCNTRCKMCVLLWLRHCVFVISKLPRFGVVVCIWSPVSSMVMADALALFALYWICCFFLSVFVWADRMLSLDTQACTKTSESMSNSKQYHQIEEEHVSTIYWRRQYWTGPRLWPLFATIAYAFARLSILRSWSTLTTIHSPISSVRFLSLVFILNTIEHAMLSTLERADNKMVHKTQILLFFVCARVCVCRSVRCLGVKWRNHTKISTEK